MKTILYKAQLLIAMTLLFLMPMNGDEAAIQGPNVIEAPYIAEGYVFYTCPDGYHFVETAQDGMLMRADGTLVLQPRTTNASITLRASNAQGHTLSYKVTIQASWVLTQHAKDYQIPEKTTPSKLQSYNNLANDKERANYIRISTLLVAMLIFYLYIYIHHKIRGGDQ